MNKLIPPFPEFDNILYDYKPKLLSELTNFGSEISELSLGILYGYRESLKFRVTKIYNNICVYGIIDNIPSFLQPIGDNKFADTIDLCLNYLKKTYGKGRIHAVPKNKVAIFRNNSKYHISDDRNNYDYIYKTTDLINLKGTKFHSKRNFVIQFKKRYRYEFRELKTVSQIEECIKLQKKWSDAKDCYENSSLMMENKCTIELLQNFHKLNLLGGILLIDGTIQGFTISESVIKSTAMVHIEKANVDFRGIYQVINQLFCENFLKQYEFVNREQDLGFHGLRKAKLSYNPVFMIEKYNIEPRLFS